MNTLKTTALIAEVLWKPYPLRRVLQVDCAFRPAGWDCRFVQRVEDIFLSDEYVPRVTQVVVEILAKRGE